MHAEESRSQTQPTGSSADRHDWSGEDVRALFDLSCGDLMYRAQTMHRENLDASQVQMSTLLSIRTGDCSEDCTYCPQSALYEAGVKAERLMPLDAVLHGCGMAQPQGDRNLESVCRMVEGVRELGMETYVTLGMLSAGQAEAGLDYCNHNLDTSAEFYGEIITMRNYQDRLDKLTHVRTAGINV